MTKQQAIDLFGGVGKLAKALGITSQAVSLWSDGDLPSRRTNEVIGAAVRLGVWPLPEPCAPVKRKSAKKAA